jgi:hypothetical protein
MRDWVHENGGVADHMNISFSHPSGMIGTMSVSFNDTNTAIQFKFLWGDTFEIIPK